jgi:L-rhamnose isomerase
MHYRTLWSVSLIEFKFYEFSFINTVWKVYFILNILKSNLVAKCLFLIDMHAKEVAHILR